MERTALVYALIVTGIVLFTLVRAFLERKPAWRRFFERLGKIEPILVAVLLSALIFFGCFQILLRNVFHRGIVWTDPLMRHIVLWLGCLGGMMATSRVRHISIDVLSQVIPERMLPMRNKLIHLATAIAASFLGLAALRLVIDERSFGEKTFWNLDVWMLQIILPVAFFFICYRSLLNMLLGRKAKALEWEDIEPS